MTFENLWNQQLEPMLTADLFRRMADADKARLMCYAAYMEGKSSSNDSSFVTVPPNVDLDELLKDYRNHENRTDYMP